MLMFFVVVGGLSCKDLTWGLFAGVDTVEYTNKLQTQQDSIVRE